jgi:hypothetical protein
MRRGWCWTRAREQGVLVTVWAVGVVRDEADIIESTLARMLREVDHVLVADNGSVDGTGEILRSFDGVTVLVDPDPDFLVDEQQARRTTALASLARQRGADWVVPFDADEVWVAPGGRIGDVLDDLPQNVHIAQAAMVNHVVTDRDPPGPDPSVRMVYRRPIFHHLPKVACRTAPGLWIANGNHRVTYQDVAEPRRVDGLLLVHHFPFRSAEQFVRKIRFKADRKNPPRMSDKERAWARILEEEGEAALAARFDEDHRHKNPDEAGLVLDPCPDAP